MKNWALILLFMISFHAYGQETECKNEVIEKELLNDSLLLKIKNQHDTFNLLKGKWAYEKIKLEDGSEQWELTLDSKLENTDMNISAIYGGYEEYLVFDDKGKGKQISIFEKNKKETVDFELIYLKNQELLKKVILDIKCDELPSTFGIHKISEDKLELFEVLHLKNNKKIKYIIYCYKKVK